MHVLVVVDVRVPAYAVLEADVQVIPETAVQHHVSHHPYPVFNLEGGNGQTSVMVLGQSIRSYLTSQSLRFNPENPEGGF